MSVAHGQHAGPRPPWGRRARFWIGEIVRDQLVDGVALAAGVLIQHAWQHSQPVTILGSALVIGATYASPHAARDGRDCTPSVLVRLATTALRLEPIVAATIGVALGWIV